MTTWTTHKEPLARWWYVRDAETGAYLEGEFSDAMYFAGIPAWKQKRAEDIAALLSGIYDGSEE